jgi:hypothetical protein
MKDDTDSLSEVEKKHPKVLLTIITIFGVLYFILIISYYVDGFIDGFKVYNLEIVITNLAFIVFLIGYYFCWKNELIAGIIFIFWWGIMWILGLFIAEQDRGSGVVMGLPFFILGVILIIFWYGNKEKADTPINTQ